MSSTSSPSFTLGRSHTNNTAGKTQLKPGAVESMRESIANGHSQSLGESTTLPGNTFMAVPRRSNPEQFRLLGTHKGGGGDSGPTSFPVNRPEIMQAFQGSLNSGQSFVDAPDTPPPSPREQKTLK